jgi:hypothetical protein
VLHLNNIIAKLQEIQENHAQLNDFRFGNPADYGSEDSISYPMLGAWLEPSVLSKRQFTTKLRLYVVDLVNQGASDELPEIGMRNDVLSDTQLVLLDVYAQLWEYFDDNSIELSPDATISHIEGGWTDAIYGWQSEIDIRQFYSRDTCQVPTRVQSAPPLVPYLTTSLTLDIPAADGGTVFLEVNEESALFYFIGQGISPTSGNCVVTPTEFIEIYNPVTASWVAYPNSITIAYENGLLLTEKSYKVKITASQTFEEMTATAGQLTYQQSIYPTN